MNDKTEWEELISRHLRGELDESEKEHLAELLDTDAAARKEFVEYAQWDTRFAEVLRESQDAFPEPGSLIQRRNVNRLKLPLAVAMAIVVALLAFMHLLPVAGEPKIATITGLSGPLQWTGDGGRVFHNLSVGAELAGGTVEGMTPGSWFELKFNDGSTVTISGTSTLIFADHGQKELHLKAGNLSSNVKPQPIGKPMLIYTPSALLEVLGTQFEVETELAATTLNVSKGSVRITRLSDGQSVDVPAKHRVLAAADREMLPQLVPDSVTRWKSQLHLGPKRTQGKWSPATVTQAARLSAIPYTSPRGGCIYTVGFGVSGGDKAPVTLQAASRVRVHGRIASPHKVYFGVTVRNAVGEFAGRFQTTRPGDEFQSGQEFEVVLPLEEFQLDPSLKQMKNNLPGDPFNLVIETFWCHTLGQQAGLEIIELELLPPGEEESK